MLGFLFFPLPFSAVYNSLYATESLCGSLFYFIFALYAMVQYLGSCAILLIAVLILHLEPNLLLLGSRVASKALVLCSTVMLVYIKPQVLTPAVINLKKIVALLAFNPESFYSLLSAVGGGKTTQTL